MRKNAFKLRESTPSGPQRTFRPQLLRKPPMASHVRFSLLNLAAALLATKNDCAFVSLCSNDNFTQSGFLSASPSCHFPPDSFFYFIFYSPDSARGGL